MAPTRVGTNTAHRARSPRDERRRPEIGGRSIPGVTSRRRPAVLPQPRQPRRTSLIDEVRDLIADDLIFSRACRPGELLPSEKELSERYAVSRVTVRASVRSLQEAGLVNVRNGVGAVVMPVSRTVTHGFDRLVSLETFAREAGKQVDSVQVQWDEEVADDQAAERLCVPVGHPLLTVRRVKTVDGTPVAWFVDSVPSGVLPFDVLRDEFNGSVLDVLLAHDELGVAYEDADLEPVNLPSSIARHLNVRPNTGALFVDAVTWNIDGTALEWARFWLLPEHFRFSVRRRKGVGRTHRRGAAR